MNKDSIQNFQSALKDFLKEEQLERTFKQKQLIANWEKVMGKTIASRTSKIFFKDKTIFVKLTSAPLKQELQNSREEFLKLINNELGREKINEIKII
ncbi:MAG: DUF721 domain-containing protein [Bacteroidota bacterium]